MVQQQLSVVFASTGKSAYLRLQSFQIFLSYNWHIYICAWMLKLNASWPSGNEGQWHKFTTPKKCPVNASAKFFFGDLRHHICSNFLTTPPRCPISTKFFLWALESQHDRPFTFLNSDYFVTLNILSRERVLIFSSNFVGSSRTHSKTSER